MKDSQWGKTIAFVDIWFDSSQWLDLHLCMLMFLQSNQSSIILDDCTLVSWIILLNLQILNTRMVDRNGRHKGSKQWWLKTVIFYRGRFSLFSFFSLPLYGLSHWKVSSLKSSNNLIRRKKVTCLESSWYYSIFDCLLFFKWNGIRWYKTKIQKGWIGNVCYAFLLLSNLKSWNQFLPLSFCFSNVFYCHGLCNHDYD